MELLILLSFPSWLWPAKNQLRDEPVPKYEPTVRTDRDLQDDLIRYLANARLRRKGPGKLPLPPPEAQKADRFARFLARRYYRDRLVRSFRYSRLFAKQIGRVAEEVVDGDLFDIFLDECVLGSLEASRRVGEMAVVHLTLPSPPGPWWLELLQYEQGFFLQAATAENGPVTYILRRGTSALCRPFHWNLPEILPRLKAGQPIAEDMKKDVVLLFSRTTSGRIYVVEVDKITEQVLHFTNGLRKVEQIAAAASLPVESVQTTLQGLSEIGAVVLPPS